MEELDGLACICDWSTQLWALGSRIAGHPPSLDSPSCSSMEELDGLAGICAWSTQLWALGSRIAGYLPLLQFHRGAGRTGRYLRLVHTAVSSREQDSLLSPPPGTAPPAAPWMSWTDWPVSVTGTSPCCPPGRPGCPGRRDGRGLPTSPTAGARCSRWIQPGQ